MFPQIIKVGPTVPYVYVFIENYFLSLYVWSGLHYQTKLFGP